MFIKIFSILLFLFSVNVLACPNLGGNYSCANSDQSWNMSITQTQENGVIVYKKTGGQNEGTYFADGKVRPHKVIANEEELNGTLSTKCLGPKVIIQFLANYQGSPIDFSETINYSNGTLVVDDVTKMGGRVFETTGYECKLNN